MRPGEFLRLMWPDEGFYCILWPFVPEGQATPVYVQKVFPTISEAVTYVHEIRGRTDVYFCVNTLKQERVWDPEKKDYKTGGKGAWANRIATNILASKASFFDLDVGAEDQKYDTQRDALVGLVEFLKATKLPEPTLVSSGGGVHVYWHYSEAVPIDEWRTVAAHLRQLAEHHKLKVDPTRTLDVTSVLRVPDTHNWKNRSDPKPVKVLGKGAVTPFATFARMVSDALIAAGQTPQAAPTPRGAAPVETAAILGANIEFEDFGPPPPIEDVAAACGQVREILRAHGNPQHPHYGALDNTAWYRGMLATLKHVANGAALCRKLTGLFPRTNSDVDEKLQQLERFGPAKCETLQQYMPWKDAPCKGCRFFNDPSTPNPLVAARKTAVAPPPQLEAPSPPPPPPPPSSAAAELAAAASPHPSALNVLIPNPPKPYERLKAGGIAITRKDKDGNETTSVIYGNDLHPVKRLVNSVDRTEQQIWRVTLPRIGAKDFTIDADVLYDGRKFSATMAHNGIYPNKADIPALQDYMVAYISKLQRELDADNQHPHLGWTENYRRFVLPDKVLADDGAVLPGALTRGAERASQHIVKRGNMARQIELLRFYEHPAYIPSQMMILASLGSIIFYATGHHGIVANASGDAGASKSSTLYTAASLWGDPVLLPINGTNRGATHNARSQRIAVNANLPTMVDEITHMLPRDIADMCMSVTQPGHRIRLQTDGVERQEDGGYKSAIMLTTANSSLHTALSIDNSAGTAGSMRVFEMRFRSQGVHSKAEADDFLRELREHHGHIGEVFAQFVVRNRAAVERRVQEVVRTIDKEAKIATSERFWSAFVAVALVAAEICEALKLLNYDGAAIRKWAIEEQIPAMRGTVDDEYRDPLAILTDYIAETNGQIVLVDKNTAIGANAKGVAAQAEVAFNLNTPHGALEGHLDIKAKILLLRKQGFKEYCQRVGASSTRVIDELSVPRARGGGKMTRVITSKSVRRTLGAGTTLAKGQSWCFVIDMSHPDIAGEVPIPVPDPSEIATKAAEGNLRAVAND